MPHTENTDHKGASNPSLESLLLTMITALKREDTRNEKFYDSADLKRLLNISDKTLYRMRVNKSIPCVRFGKKYFYPKSYFNNKASE
ncbi:helix-turn-helix domain-containing protein [Elizabethkingia meningoseptica]|uniref:DNA-binding protein n=1 Tax=Elizabethkingia meningoseptica TaxID=238 RepID=A0A1V3U0H4_ELIME|nr:MULTISPECIES: helix-turn-helix domain-containing protein [Elizabethkingia]AQX06197.1 hypothetical protein BBD33_13460 [Elizabethkingia meningoseptica]AQX13729.1 hypothetical protein BBD35_15715 [Elizabethkingia meningoseptica]AQX48245.1 hypothetical protein B5G46_13455 [Elizabethkingia meningoseptica]EJK5327370.1 helix-turn-helix domain-containing protein [Elizabethkingia meningoseptica]EOR28893.1 hypothetical protein L100_13974 [Elizabethkingia meningoseptica ATCC 13253 = NBRC 12535]